MCIRLATNKEWKMLRRNFFSDHFSRIVFFLIFNLHLKINGKEELVA